MRQSRKKAFDFIYEMRFIFPKVPGSSLQISLWNILSQPYVISPSEVKIKHLNVIPPCWTNPAAGMETHTLFLWINKLVRLQNRNLGWEKRRDKIVRDLNRRLLTAAIEVRWVLSALCCLTVQMLPRTVLLVFIFFQGPVGEIFYVSLSVGAQSRSKTLGLRIFSYICKPF